MAQHPLPNTKAWISGFMLLLQDVCRPVNWALQFPEHPETCSSDKKNSSYSVWWHRIVSYEVTIHRLKYSFSFPLRGWSLTRSINVKKRVFYLFLTKREVWHTHLICFPWANPCFSHSGTRPLLPFKIHFQVVICHCRRYWGERT